MASFRGVEKKRPKLKKRRYLYFNRILDELLVHRIGTLEPKKEEIIVSEKDVAQLWENSGIRVPREQRSEVRNILAKLLQDKRKPLLSFYSKRGARHSKIITQAIQAVLGENSPFEQDFIRKWREATAPIERAINYKISTSREEMALLGYSQGDKRSCFRTRGQYAHHVPALYHQYASFVVWLSERSQFPEREMTLHDVKEIVDGRCWGIAELKRTQVYLSNFYFGGMDNRKGIFVNVMRDVMGLPEVRSRSCAVKNIGVYNNSDGITVSHADIEPFGEIDFEMGYCMFCGTRGDLICNFCAS